jgi:hypothetical protein
VRTLPLVVLTPMLLAASPTQVITSSGRIGALQVDVSSRAAIVATVGRPDAERTGSFNGSRQYRALGYECSSRESDVTWPLLAHGPYCRTVFFLDPRDGRLGDVFTTSRRFRDEHGVRIGMATATAESLLRRRVFLGCEANVYIGRLTIAFTGGHRGPNGHLLGGHVYAFALHSRAHDVGVFDCL